MENNNPNVATKLFEEFLGNTSGLLSVQTVLDTPGTRPTFSVKSFSGRDAISELFIFQLELLSPDPNIAFDSIVGKRLDVGIRLSDGETIRYFDGFVSRFTQLTPEGRFARYHVQVVPWVWFLTRTTDCRIFQNRTIPDIIGEVFKHFGFEDFEDRTQRTYKPWEYCVQYRESAYSFVARLMEQEGIFFYFEHHKGKHVLVMADSPSVHQKCTKVRYRHFGGRGLNMDEDGLADWCPSREIRSTRYVLDDYNFESPGSSLLSVAEIKVPDGSNSYEVYDYPGEFETRVEGEDCCELRLDAETVCSFVVNGAGNCRSFAAGYLFDVGGLDRRDQEGTYLLTSVAHEAYEEQGTGGTEAGATNYNNSFVCIPRAVKFRPPIKSRRPTVQGPQTAVVVGPAHEETYTDKYGRVKVQFRWDRINKHDERSSCWIRVAHPCSGKGWGAITIPRIGHEVIVEFLDGDPDRPIITGSVYNAENMPPYPLPAHHTQSGIRSRSSKDGNRQNFNEIKFEDKKGNEELIVHAERFKGESVEEDSEESVGRDRTLSVGGSQTEIVKGNKHSSVQGEHREKIHGDMSLQVGGARHEKMGSLYAAEVGQEIHLKAGTKIVIEAGTQVTLRGPGGFVDVGPEGVTIQGKLVRINTGGSGATGSGASPKDPEKPPDKSSSPT